jgi:hypothetical protein
MVILHYPDRMFVDGNCNPWACAVSPVRIRDWIASEVTCRWIPRMSADRKRARVGVCAARFVETIQAVSTCPVLLAKIFPFPSDANHLHIFRHPGPHRGAFRDRHGRRAGMRWTRAAPKTRALACGRRSRVVLTPRRWRQVGGGNSTCDGGKKARSPGRARSSR